MGELDGKVAIVTGASRGIGAQIARRFGAAGASVVVTARTMQPGVSPFEGTVTETVADIVGAGGTAIGIAADLSRPDERERLVADTVAQLGPVDILVNNAAVTFFEPIAEFPAKRMSLMFAVQVEAPMHLAQLVLASMRERRSGWILNISSRAALHPALPPARRPGGTVYGMCKAALERFSTGLAAEVFPDGIAVNALSPNQVVPTAGTVFHRLTTVDSPANEPPTVMAEAAFALCTGPAVLADGRPGLTGRIAYSQDLLAELQEKPWVS
jgi:NAD(P)-dependent dehydrogenase (short-subunit alcohol dehydrogenase family)